MTRDATRTTPQHATTWTLSRFGEDEPAPRRQLTWRHLIPCALALAVGIYGGLMLAAALFT